MKEFEWFEWFGPSPIEPFNSAARPRLAHPNEALEVPRGRAREGRGRVVLASDLHVRLPDTDPRSFREDRVDVLPGVPDDRLQLAVALRDAGPTSAKPAASTETFRLYILRKEKRSGNRSQEGEWMAMSR